MRFENDEYYGSEPTKQTYEEMHKLYEEQGLDDAEIDKLLVLAVLTGIKNMCHKS